MLLASGTRSGRYEIVAPLGASGMGEVHRAESTVRFHLTTNDTCAAAVAGWPDQKLNAAGLRTSNRTEDHSRPNGCDVRLSSGSADRERAINLRAVTYAYRVNIVVDVVQG
jgi:hypothetical protein